MNIFTFFMKKLSPKLRFDLEFLEACPQFFFHIGQIPFFEEAEIFIKD